MREYYAYPLTKEQEAWLRKIELDVAKTAHALKRLSERPKAIAESRAMMLAEARMTHEPVEEREPRGGIIFKYNEKHPDWIGQLEL